MSVAGLGEPSPWHGRQESAPCVLYSCDWSELESSKTAAKTMVLLTQVKDSSVISGLDQ
jgi:hypothetical protein